GSFPLESGDDISSLFPSLKESIEYPEERRLFYVAMTRARKKLFIVTRPDNDDVFSAGSIFVKEIIADNRADIAWGTPRCAKCGWPMRIISGKFGVFYGCRDYPKCSGDTVKFES
ncbi:MAG: topoisomerase DNA-binding C4 zinc finger domain-containing protein, partial [Candidatus Methanoplasma sp.]|nr:topoisomerase DNA-binding C4 zinc finger domain-containing protein [Candidatus Methanoplasma sp.]